MAFFRSNNTSKHVCVKTLCLASLIILCAVGSACSTTPRVAVDDDRVNRIYDRLDQVVEEYRQGLEAVREGERGQADGLIESATNRLAEAADDCVNASGCDVSRVLSTYELLLGSRASLLTSSEEGLLDLDASDESEGSLISDIPEAGRSVNLLNGQALSDVISVNGPVRAALHDWLTWMRPQLMDAFENYQAMRHLMWPAYEEAGLPEALLFGILAKESGARVHAVSHAGAAGPFQFMYHTGRRFGLGQIDGFDTRYDPAIAAKANVAYLQEQFRFLNNNLELTLAAYNGGEGRMRRLFERSRTKTFWSADIMGRLPRETQEYVPYVLAAAWIFLHPEENGVVFPALTNGPGSVRLTSPMTLSEIAICVGQTESRNGWFRSLRNLNPRFDPNQRLAKGTEVNMPSTVVAAYESKCQEGPFAELAQRLQDARQPGGIASAGGRQYIVRRGDTLAAISKRFRCPSPESIARANNIPAPRYLIRPEQRLVLSGCAG
jgi:membrane-bound lytic murein transglycosylase D